MAMATLLTNPAIGARTDLTSEQLERAAALRAASQMGDFLPEDLLAVARFILTGEIERAREVPSVTLNANWDAPIPAGMPAPLAWEPSIPMVTTSGIVEPTHTVSGNRPRITPLWPADNGMRRRGSDPMQAVSVDPAMTDGERAVQEWERALLYGDPEESTIRQRHDTEVLDPESTGNVG